MQAHLFSFKSWSKVPDLRVFLAWQLAGVVEAWWQGYYLETQPYPEQAEGFEPKILALRRSRGDRPLYWSAIALHVAQQISLRPLTSQAEGLSQIAQALAAVWNQFAEAQATSPSQYQLPEPLDSLPLPNLWPHCRAEAMPNGMIALRVADAGLAWWLNLLGEEAQSERDGSEVSGSERSDSEPSMLELPVLQWRSLGLQQAQSASPPPLAAKRLFTVQAAHARCCSLIRLAEQVELVKLAAPAVQSDATTALGSWAIAYPYPFPWLQTDQTFRFTHPAEHHLIAQLLTTVEILCSQSPASAQILQIADGLAQAFQQFYAACRIFSEVRTQIPELAQARLGLVWVTRAVLKRLLNDGLNAIAPTEL